MTKTKDSIGVIDKARNVKEVPYGFGWLGCMARQAEEAQERRRQPV